MYRTTIYDTDNDVTIVSDIENYFPEHQVSYNREIGVYSVTFPTEITFHGSLYQRLWEAFQTNYKKIYDILVEKECEGVYTTIFDGKILLTDANFEPLLCKVTLSLTNDNYQFKIDNNFDVPVSILAEQTKNSTDASLITIVAPTYIYMEEMQFYNKNGIPPYVASPQFNVKVYDLKDVFTHIVRYISDNTVGFESYWYDNIEDTKHIGVSTGHMFRVADAEFFPIISLRDLFTTIKKLYDVVILFERDSDDNPVLRLERPDYLSNNGNVVTIIDFDNLNITIDQTQLYNSVKVGSSSSFQNNTEINNDFTFPKIQGSSFALEEFNVQSEVNIQSQLDLSIEWIIDHNVLEDIAVNDNIEYDEDIILLQYTASTSTATKGDTLGIASLSNNDGFYNQDFLNNEILKRQRIFGTLVLHTNNDLDTFFAQNYRPQENDFAIYSFIDTTPTSGTLIENTQLITRHANDYTAVTYNNGDVLLSNDINNNYGNGTVQGVDVSATNSRFTAPSSGVYVLESKMYFLCIFAYQHRAYYEHRLIITNSSDVEIARYTNYFNVREYVFGGSTIDFNADGSYSDYSTSYDSNNDRYLFVQWKSLISQGVYMDAGHKAYVSVYVAERDTQDAYPIENILPQGQQYIYGESGIEFRWVPIYFACTKTANGGSIVTSNGNGSPDIYNIQFDAWLTNAQIQDIIESSNTNVILNNTEFRAKGLAANIAIQHKDNMCNFTVGAKDVKQ